MGMNQTVILREVEADHDGWEAEVEQMDRDVAYLFRGLETEVTRYVWHGSKESDVLRVGYETSSPRVLKKAKKLGWLR